MKLLTEAMVEEGASEPAMPSSYLGGGLGGFNKGALEQKVLELVTTLEGRARSQELRAKTFAFYANHLPAQRSQFLRFEEVDRLEFVGDGLGGDRRYLGTTGF